MIITASNFDFARYQSGDYGDHCIIHGDCRDVLPKIPDKTIDLVLTDPPYGIRVDSTMSKQGGTQYGVAAAPKRCYKSTGWDDEPIDQTFINSIIAVAPYAVLWGGNYYRVEPSSSWLIWDKQINGNFADAEMAWTNFPQAVRLKKHLWNGMLRKGDEQRHHPTQKPLEIMLWCIAQCDKHQQANLILDPFLGSGTTLVAAKNLGRRAIGVEINYDYCKIAEQRLSQEVLAL